MPEPHFDRPRDATYDLRGYLGAYIKNVTSHWLLQAPDANPAMLQMFRDRDLPPYRDLLAWSGEFAGKYLTSATQVLRLTGSQALRAYLEQVVNALVSLQAEDGYLGPWPKAHRLTGSAPNTDASGVTWDAWGHYHMVLGLLLWYDESGDSRALEAARRIGDLFVDRFLGDKSPRLVDTGSTEMNLAPAHALCLLYKHTHDDRYLQLAEQVVGEFAVVGVSGTPLAGNYLAAGLAGVPFYQLPKPRWESIHPVLSLAELYYLTGQEQYRRAFESLWWSIVQYDRHNNGGFSSGEQAQGDPYHPGAIETCCTIAWMAMTVEMLRLTGLSAAADELELSTLNSVTGMHSPTGRWATYNTPMDGVRRASAHEIVFQARAGSPELNCCSVNSPRGLGLLSDWALMAAPDGLVLNWYGPGKITAHLPGGAPVTLRQQTRYPRSGSILLTLELPDPQLFTLRLRIPGWSQQTQVSLNGAALPPVTAGSYLALERRWKKGDQVRLMLDFNPHFWVGEGRCAGQVSIYRGPLLLAYDRAYNDLAPDALPQLDAARLSLTPITVRGRYDPFLLVSVVPPGHPPIRLCDFGSAGYQGTFYRSWLPGTGAPPVAFNQANPLRSTRPAS